MDTETQNKVNTALIIVILIIVIVLCIIAMLIFYYNKNKSLTAFNIIHAIPIILVIILIYINESISLISTFSFVLLLAKFFISVVAVSNLNNYYPDDPIQNYIANMKDILANASKDTNIYLSVFKKYLPVMVLNGLLMITLYVIFTTDLRVNLSLASNCAKSNYTVEYTTLRKKINEFAKNNDNDLKLYLIVMIISFLCALGVIFYLLYTDTIEIQYVMIIPILIFLIVFASMVIDKIDRDYFDSDKGSTEATSIGSILAPYITLPIIGLFGVSLFIV
jgi:hypothetical protein